VSLLRQIRGFRMLASTREMRVATREMRICPQCHTETEAERCATDGYGTVFKRTPEPESNLTGTTFQSRYRIEEILGSGGMGAVYRAVQLSVDRPVALKVIHSRLADNLSDVARFQQEARAIAALHHPNIVSLIDFGQADTGELFLVMEYLNGVSLGKLIRDEAPLPVERIIQISRQIFEALHHAHSYDIVHRDMKPENILVTQMGRKSDFVKVLDFGIAKVNNEASPLATITQTGTIVGSPRYMAPEQARGREVTGQTDLYAVGAMMYEMLTGRAVFEAFSATECVVMHVTQPPPRPVVHGQYVRGKLVSLILSLLEKDPRARPPGADACLQALEALGDDALIVAGPALPAELGSNEETRAAGDSSDSMPATMTIGEWRGVGEPTVATPAPIIDIDTRRATTASELGIHDLELAEKDPNAQSNRIPELATEPKSTQRLWWTTAASAVLAAGLVLVLVLLNSGDSSEGTEKVASSPLGDASVSSSVQESTDVVDSSLPLIRANHGLPKKDAIEPATASPLNLAETEKGAKNSIEAIVNPKEPTTVARELLSIPSGATVMLGRKKIGITPQTIRWREDTEAPVVELLRFGYKPLTVTMEASNEGISQKVRLKRKRIARPSTSSKPNKKPSKKPNWEYVE
jgi:serine/threonine protein kinase